MNKTKNQPASPERERGEELRTKNKKQGLSLLELLIVLGILSIISVMLVTSFSSITKGRGAVEARTTVNSELRFAFQKIEQDIRGASSLTTPAVPLGTSANTLVVVIGGSNVTYDVSLGRLRRTVGAGTPEYITASSTLVGLPTFTRLENYNVVLNATTTSISVSIPAWYNSSSTDWQYSETRQATMSLR